MQIEELHVYAPVNISPLEKSNKLAMNVFNGIPLSKEFVTYNRMKRPVVRKVEKPVLDMLA